MCDLPEKTKSEAYFSFGSCSSKYNTQKGQALLIILLLMTVVLTILLSVASKSVTEISISTHEQDSARALSAAEAGIEDVLITGGSVSTTLTNNATYTADVTMATSENGDFVYPEEFRSGETATFWLVSHNDSGELTCTDSTKPCFDGNRLKFCWGEDGAPLSSAIELMFYHDQTGSWESGTKDFSNIKVKRLAYDPKSSTRSDPTYFTQADIDCKVSGKNFAYSTPTLNLNTLFSSECGSIKGCILMVRARIFFNGDDAQPIAITTTTSRELPAQGANIDSTGQFNDVTRRVSVFRSYPSPLDIFDSTLFSYGGLEK